MLNKNNKCLFSYLNTLEFTIEIFKLIYYYTQASNNQTTVNKDVIIISKKC